MYEEMKCKRSSVKNYTMGRVLQTKGNLAWERTTLICCTRRWSHCAQLLLVISIRIYRIYKQGTTFLLLEALYLPFFVGGGWSLSQLSLGERQGTPWTGRQSSTGSTNFKHKCPWLINQYDWHDWSDTFTTTPKVSHSLDLINYLLKILHLSFGAFTPKKQQHFCQSKK